jgi:hypothetical protein
MKARFWLLVIVLFAMFPTALVAACKVVFGALLQIAADISGVHIQ